MHAVVTCGWCGSANTHYETVDNGVGHQQVTAAECGRCGAVQIGPNDWFDKSVVIEPEDAKRGWYQGPDTLQYVTWNPRTGTYETAEEASVTLYATMYNNGERLLVLHNGMVHQAFKRIAFRRATFQMLCGDEAETAVRPAVEAITCFRCLTAATTRRV